MNIILPEISVILADIFNLSVKTGNFINIFKTAKIIPLFKNKGSTSDVSSYRPIALLSNIDKIFEKLVHKRVISYFDKHKIISDRQFGFRNKHSTQHNLISLTENIRDSLDEGNFSCGIFLDLQKAFDTVEHKILLKKLEIYSIRGIANKWFESYLTNRKQFVFLNGLESDLRPVYHGVPQGSVLGPLLFLIYINDLQNAIVYSDSFIFADDTALVCSNKSLKAIKKRVNIDLKLLSSWLASNKIDLNVKKTEVILFKHPNKKLNYNVKLKLNGKRLQFTNRTRYLGVLIDESLSWKFHHNDLATKLQRTNGILAKIRHYVPQSVTKLCYYALFNSRLMYGLQSWGQNLSTNNRITKLQKTAVRIMTFSRPDAQSQPLFKELSILPVTDLIFLSNIQLVYNTLKRETPSAIQNALDFDYLPDSYFTRGKNEGLLKRPKATTTAFGLYSIKYRSVIHWNALQTFYRSFKLISLSTPGIKKVALEFLSLQSHIIK